MTHANAPNTAPRKPRGPFRPAPLAVSMALLWSSTTLAAPGEPILERLAPEPAFGESNPSAKVKVSWQRLFGDPAVSARYLVNDQLVATRAVDAGAFGNHEDTQSGGATLTFRQDGEYEIVVELCNAEGCTDAAPMLIDVWDPWVDRDPEPTALADLDTVMAKNQEMVARLTDGQQSSQQQVWLGTFASLVGKAGWRTSFQESPNGSRVGTMW